MKPIYLFLMGQLLSFVDTHPNSQWCISKAQSDMEEQQNIHSTSFATFQATFSLCCYIELRHGQ